MSTSMKTIEIGRKYVFLRQVQEKPGTNEKIIVLFGRYAMCKSNFQADTKNILEMPRTLIQVVKEHTDVTPSQNVDFSEDTRNLLMKCRKLRCQEVSRGFEGDDEITYETRVENATKSMKKFKPQDPNNVAETQNSPFKIKPSSKPF